MASVKLLERVLHNGRIHEIGSEFETDAEHAERLVERGVAEVVGSARARKRAGTDPKQHASDASAG